MNTKKIVLGVAAIAILACLIFGYTFFNSDNQPQNTEVGPEMASYAGDADISFSYPNSYILTQRHDSYQGNPIKVMTLIQNGVEVPDMSDGPQAISIIEVPSDTTEPLSAWVKSHSISNFALSPDQVLASTTLAGEPAVSYTHSGLYESKAVAVKHGKNIFVLSVGSVDASDRMYEDFQNILKTVQFK